MTASKYERRLDRRTFVDKKSLFEGVRYNNKSEPAKSAFDRGYCVIFFRFRQGFRDFLVTDGMQKPVFRVFI